MPTNKTLLTTGVILCLMLIGAVLGIYTGRFYQSAPSPDTIAGLLWPNPKQLTEFTTIDHNGRPYGAENLKGHWSLLFFGYTYCPDVCPLTLTVLGQLHKKLQSQPDLSDTRTLFITVDPDRDNTARLAEYIAYFNQNFIALGGTTEQVDGLASQIGIAWSHALADTEGNYMVNHSSAVFLLDPDARLVGIFSAPHDADSILASMVRITEFIKSQD